MQGFFDIGIKNVSLGLGRDRGRLGWVGFGGGVMDRARLGFE